MSDLVPDSKMVSENSSDQNLDLWTLENTIFYA
jgi:hypothetical protein